MFSQQNVVMGNSVDVNVNPCASQSEIRADVVVSQFKAVRVWGKVVTCNNEPVPNALVKLLKIIDNCSCQDYEGVAHTVSDCNGFYQFDICSDENAWYKILVGKSTIGKEVVLDTRCCTPADSPCCSACDCTPC